MSSMSVWQIMGGRGEVHLEYNYRKAESWNLGLSKGSSGRLREAKAKLSVQI